jgi:DUF1680 family protein
MAQLQDHVAVADETSLTLGILAAGQFDSPALDIDVETAYPFGGTVEVRVRRASPDEVSLALRVPGWARGATATLDGDPVPGVTTGWLRLTRRWTPGERLRLELPMRVRRVVAHPHVDATRGAVAVVRGPVVHCLEQQDAPAAVDDLVLVGAREAVNPGQDAVTARAVEGLFAVRPARSADPYPELDASGEATDVESGASSEPAPVIPVPLVPYFLWGNREPAAMRVWLRQS